MNKIKLMYDVVKTMKEKDIFQGELKLEVKKNEECILRVDNEFYKDCKKGEAKIKLTTEALHDGKKVKHHSETEFQGDCCGEHHHLFMKHFHQMHQNKGCMEGHFNKCCGLKGKLNKIAFILGVFHNMKITETEDKGYILNLNLSEIPEDLKKALHEKMEHKMKGHDKACCMDLQGAEFLGLEIMVKINKNNEIEKIEVNAKGKCCCEEAKEANVELKAEVNFVW